MSDTLTITRRNLLVWMRVPAYIMFTVIQPVMFVLLFRYVFGGAIPVPGVPGGYVNFLMPGIIGQSAAFATFGTAIALAQELKKGVIDRLKSMPMARSAVLAGRLVADTGRMFITILILVGVGYAVGFRFQNGFGLAVAMVVLATIFGLAICCIAAFTGLAIGDEESVQAFGLVWLFPLTFVSSAFVPISTMPGWLQAFAKHQPVTIVIDTMRSMALGGPIATNLLLSIAWPQVLFLDEPTTGLDPRARLGMWDIIRSLVADGTTLLLTTQYLDEADELADEIVVIDHGLVIASGTAEDLKDRVGGDVLEFTVPDRTGSPTRSRLAKVGEGEPHMDEDTGVINVGVGGRGSDALIEAVRALDGAGVATQGLSLRRPSLDDVFLALTGHAAEEEEPPAKGRRGRRRSAKKDTAGASHDRRDRSHHRAAGRGPSLLTRARWAISDTLTITRRNLLVWLRVPAYIVFTVIQPVMFVLLFRYVFGGAIQVRAFRAATSTS